MNTFFALMAEYGTAQIPVERCAALFGLDPKEATRRAALHRLPVPAFRVGTQKSPWLVDATQLAQHLDEIKAKAQTEWEKMRA